MEQPLATTINLQWRWEIDSASIAFVAIILLMLLRPPLHTAYSSKPARPLGAALHGNESVEKKYGIDVSHYQGAINWPIAAQSAAFIYMKATDGITFIDPRFYDNINALKNQAMPVGAYHFYEPDDDPIKQAQHFLSTIAVAKMRLRPALDIEIHRGRSPEVISAAALRWLKYVEKSLGCKPIIYTYADFWDAYLGSPFNDYPFWLAGYTELPHPPALRDNWQLWQFSESGHILGIRQATDRDFFQGSQENFNDLFCP